ncbi:helix-turn-helix domain-containing protein [Iodidimonas sp. SYSU 1G8]|uniref:helix-turn-helix transcriptional regulator n=1 Tax=Iodidimonas sp. SYSU 1G8 TaxID=3133967 RepID=UPI0031FEB035
MSKIEPAQCRAARGLLNWNQEDLARHAGVSRSTVREFEAGHHELHRATEAQLVRALEDAGVCLIVADDQGVGVRMARPA